ncbi:MAG TPA: NAD(P)-binding domain-containing protein [Nitrospira sp.]
MPDAGNGSFHDDVRRASKLTSKGLHYVDEGTSGGILRLKIGYCLMVGDNQAPLS